MKEEPPIFTDYLSLAGRLLFVGSVLLFAAGFYWGFSVAAESGMSSFPLFVVVVPPVIVAVFVFFGGAWLFECCGIRIYTKNSKLNMGSQSAVEDTSSTQEDAALKDRE